MTVITKTSIVARIRKIVLIDLLGGECIECGSKEKLHFDHVISSEKSFTITVGLQNGMTVDDLLDELQKCQLLCSSCHGRKTRSDNHQRFVAEHGTASMYHNGKCRCNDCRKAHAAYQRSYKMKRKK